MISTSMLRGLWRRRWIEPADQVDREVYWLQTDSLFGDVRVPHTRQGRAHSLDRLDAAAARDLALCQGFAGRIELNSDICTWHRRFDWQPDQGMTDSGRIRLENGLLMEDGIHAAYSEAWERMTPPGAAGLGLALRDRVEAREGYLAVVGDYFIYVRGRARPLPEGPDLLALLDECSGADASRLLFDAEMSLGRVGDQWPITCSNYVWREGQPLFAAAADLDGATLTVAEQRHDGSATTRTWDVEAREPVGRDGSS